MGRGLTDTQLYTDKISGDEMVSDGYAMKEVKNSLQQSNPDRVPEFEKKAAEFAKKIVGKFSDWEFFTGESMNPDGMVALLNYREDGVTPYLVFWKDGLNETKI